MRLKPGKATWTERIIKNNWAVTLTHMEALAITNNKKIYKLFSSTLFVRIYFGKNIKRIN